jgi:cell division protease FtsH
MTMQPEQRRFSVRYSVAAIVALFLIEAYLFAPHPETLAYSDFVKLVKAGKVSDVTLSSHVIAGSLAASGLEAFLPKDKLDELRRAGQGTHRFVTTRVDDPQLVPTLEAANVRFTGVSDVGWLGTLASWVVPAVVFFALWSFMVRRMAGGQGGLLSFGRSKAKVYVEPATGVSFDDVAGIDEARAELMEIVDFLKNPQRYQRLGGKIPKGVLLAGAPGTGKTLLAKAVAGEAGVPFFSMNGSDFIEMFVGVGAARVRDLFEQAQAKAPSIIFIDELDALGKARGIAPAFGGHDEREQTLDQLLAQLDGFDSSKGVIIMGATNRPEILDPALMRPGRFDRKVIVDRPDLKGREKILRVHTRGVGLAPDVDLEALAARTPGFVGADLANLVNEAALSAARANKDAVEMADFDEAVDRVVGGLERRSRLISPREKEIVAHHEAGHAIVAELRPHADRVHKISIIPRGVAALGYTEQQPTEDRYLLTRAELLDRIDVLLGGRVAEEIIFDDVSTGAANDLQRATELARHMVAQYSMSERFGLASFEEVRQTFLGGVGPAAREYSEATAEAIDVEIAAILEAAHRRVHETLTGQRAALEAVAKLLIDKEVVSAEWLRTVLREPPALASPNLA